jgi:hypothetical protein
MRIWPVLILLPLLAGCTDSDWNRMLSFGGSDDAGRAPAAVATAAPTRAPAPAPTAPAAPAQAAPATLAAAAAQMNPFCLGIARQDATTHDFDTATQQKVAARSYQQCVQIFGASQP